MLRFFFCSPPTPPFFFLFHYFYSWVSVTCSLHYCSEYMLSGRVRCETKAHICKGLKLNLLIIALCWIVKADIVLPAVSRQLVQLIVQGCHGPHLQQVHSSNFFSVENWDTSSSTTCFLHTLLWKSRLHFVLIWVQWFSTTPLLWHKWQWHFVLLMYGFSFCVSTQMKLSHNLCSSIVKKGLWWNVRGNKPPHVTTE